MSKFFSGGVLQKKELDLPIITQLDNNHRGNKGLA
jgi:hypothetical protein